MIELIEGLPDGVVGFEAAGEVTSDDYAVVASAVGRAFVRDEEVPLLHVIGERFTGRTATALLEDARLGLGNVRALERIAVGTDRRHFRALVTSIGWSLPGETMLFSTDQRAEAERWVSEALASEARKPGREETGPGP